MYVRTDLALEEKELWQQSADEQTELSGVRAREYTRHGVKTTIVRILDAEGERQLHKPAGTYLTLELTALARHEKDAFERSVGALTEELRRLVKGCGSVLVAGLGNDAVTPDAIGPQTLRNLIVTRHLKKAGGAGLDGFRCVSAVQPGVLGTTGLESVELVRGAAEHAAPDLILVVDALAARDPERVCTTVQLADTGIVPGSGVGNSRAAFSRETPGVPVIAVGVPTVVDARTFLSEHDGLCNFNNCISGMVVTPRDIDARVREISRVIGYSIDLALHPGLAIEDVPCFLA